MNVVDVTLKLSDARVREILAYLCGERVGAFVPGRGSGIPPPTPNEIASIVNELIGKRSALRFLLDGS